MADASSDDRAVHDSNQRLNQGFSRSEAEILTELFKLMQETGSHPQHFSAEPIASNPPTAAEPDRTLPVRSASPAGDEAFSAASSPAASSTSQALQPATDNLDTSLLELQQLLFNFDQSHLNQLRERLENPEWRAADISAVLRQAIELHTLEQEQVKRLAAAMLKTVEQAIQDSVQQDETVMSNAIFPIVGPTIRKAIAAALENTVQSLDQLLEYSLSPQAWLWRLEALRTRRSFAEIVLMRTLQFRVEQIFLIHRETGLLLQEVIAPAVKAQDSELVSAMLRAIDSFVQDSFTVKSSESLDMLRFGDLTLWIEQGPQAILAAAVRGQAPLELRQTLRQAIEQIHRDHQLALAAFQGDATPFAAALPQLEACLQTGYRTAPKKGRPYFWALFAVMMAGLGIGGGHEFLMRRRWGMYVDRLQSEPGIVVNRAARQWGGFAIAGLRDPLAVDPVALLSDSQLDPETVTGKWQPYLSLEPPFITARARQLLQPPSSVTLRVDPEGILHATGVAPLRWIQEAQRLAPLIPGVTRFEQQVTIADWRDLQASQARIAAQLLRFEEGETTLIAGQEATIALLVQEIQKAARLAAGLNRQVQLQVIGRANPRGTPARNLALSQERANQAAAMLAARGVNSGQIKAIGVGATQPLTQTALPAEQLNRSVSFRLVFTNSVRSRSGNQ
jgi:OOP family OmpA-OmpF porin